MISCISTNSTRLPGEKSFRGLFFSRCWQIFSPTLEVVITAPPAADDRSGTAAWLGRGPAVFEERSWRSRLLLFGYLAAALSGVVLSLNPGIPKWLGIWPNYKTGHFANSYLSAHQLGKEN